MSKFTDSENYLNITQNSFFTEHDFVVMLLSLLRKNGVYRIDEELLAKKLYCYYKDSAYDELFQDIALVSDSLNRRVDVYSGLYREKFFSGNILFDSMNCETLALLYDLNADLSRYESKLSDDGKEKIRKIAEELSIQKKIEQQSQNPLYIYGIDPNHTYTLVHGKKALDTLSFELITDGDISSLQYSEVGTDEYYYEDPMYPNTYRMLKDNKAANVDLKNASFAIKQGLCNDKICYCVANTKIVDRKLLKAIMEMANKKYYDDTCTLTQQAPYVRKLTLK